jgi:hypothetical protein
VVIRDRNTLPRCARDGLKNHHSEAKFSALLQFCKWLKSIRFVDTAGIGNGMGMIAALQYRVLRVSCGY